MTAVAVGTGIYAFHLQTEVKSLLQQEVSLNDQIAQLQQQLSDATNRLSDMQDQNNQLQAGHTELLRLRGEVTRQDHLHHTKAVSDFTDPPVTNQISTFQILLESKFVSVPLEDVAAMGVQWTSSDPQSGKTGLLSKEQYKAIMEALKDASDAQVLSTPRVVTLDGMAANTSVTRAASIGGTNVNVGEEFYVIPHYSTNSSTFDLTLNAKFHFLSGDVSQPDLQSLQVTNQLDLSPGQTVIMESEIPAGAWTDDPTNASANARSLLVFVTPTAVDATGNRLSQ